MSNLVHVPGHPGKKLGLHIPTEPAAHHPLIIPFETIKAAHPGLMKAEAAAPLPTFDYRDGLSDATNALANDTLGCCTAAAKGHRAQQFTAFRKLTPLDTTALTSCVVQFYSETTGYDPKAKLNADGTNPTDGGGDMQKIAEYCVETGFPMPDGTRDKFAFAISVDPTDEAALALVGQHCQGLDFGMEVTDTVMPATGDVPLVWTVKAGEKVLGGHDTLAVGRKPNGNWIINSWGLWYEIDESFRKAHVFLVFGYVSPDMLLNGKTVMGLNLGQWLAIIKTHGQAA